MEPGSRFTGRPAKRLTVLLGVRDRHHHASLEVELLKRARRVKLMGATVFEGQMGFGTAGQVHREHFFLDDRPLAIVIIDVAQRVDAFLEQLVDFAPGIVVTVEDVEIVDI